MLHFVSVPDLPSLIICSVPNFSVVLLRPAKIEALRMLWWSPDYCDEVEAHCCLGERKHTH